MARRDIEGALCGRHSGTLAEIAPLTAPRGASTTRQAKVHPQLGRAAVHPTYQIPLSLPVIFCPTAAAVARHGNKLSRTLFRSSRFSSRVVSCDP